MSTHRVRRGNARDGLFILGLVGRAGSGKSSVGRVLVEDGAVLIEADAIGHAVTDGDPDVRRALIAEYGADVYLASGRLDRSRVAAKVFRDPEALARLNALVHPKIVERIRDEILALGERGYTGTVVVDAALMLEWELEQACDAVLAVVAPESLQIERLVRARGWSVEEARRRLQAQRTNEAFARAADAVIENVGTPDALSRAAREAVARLRTGRHAAHPKEEDA